MGGERLDCETFGIAVHQVDGAAADRSGRTQNGDRPGRSALLWQAHGQARGLLPVARASAATVTSVRIRPSTRSIMPPCPGMRAPESFTLKRRLRADSIKSPTCSAIASTPLSKVKVMTDAPSTKAATVPTAAAARMPPPRPAQVLAGLIEGASLGPPIACPAKYAPVSTAHTRRNSHATVARPAPASALSHNRAM